MIVKVEEIIYNQINLFKIYFSYFTRQLVKRESENALFSNVSNSVTFLKWYEFKSINYSL